MHDGSELVFVSSVFMRVSLVGWVMKFDIQYLIGMDGWWGGGYERKL